MPFVKFGRTVRDLFQLGQSARIKVSKEGVLFFTEGEAVNGNILLRPREEFEDGGQGGCRGGGRTKTRMVIRKVEKKANKKTGEDVEVNGDNDEDGEDEVEDDSGGRKQKHTFAKDKNQLIKSKRGADDDGFPDGGHQHVDLTFD